MTSSSESSNFLLVVTFVRVLSSVCLFAIAIAIAKSKSSVTVVFFFDRLVRWPSFETLPSTFHIQIKFFQILNALSSFFFELRINFSLPRLMLSPLKTKPSIDPFGSLPHLPCSDDIISHRACGARARVVALLSRS